MSSPHDHDHSHRLALPTGFRLEDYRMERLLGKGGFGLTYLATDESLDSPVAIKELLPDGIAGRFRGYTVGAQTEGLVETYQWALTRFVEEARLLARLSHPNIVRVVRLIEAHGTAYMVMEYVEGESLSAWMKKRGTPSQEELLSLLMPLLDGLEYLHGKGLLHRDIKPDNIIVTTQGRPVLLDFGSARVDLGRTEVATSMVSDGYSPREQYQQKARHGPFSDIYALGAVMVHAMTGTKPAGAIDRWAAPEQERPLGEHVRGTFSPHLVHAVERAFSVAPEQRWQSAAQMRQFIVEGPPPAHLGIISDPPPVGHRGGPPPLPPVDPAPPREPKPPKPVDTRSSLPGWMLFLTLLHCVIVAGLGVLARQHIEHPENLPAFAAGAGVLLLFGLIAWLRRAPWAMVLMILWMVAWTLVGAGMLLIVMERGRTPTDWSLEQEGLVAAYCALSVPMLWGWLSARRAAVQERRPPWWRKIKARPSRLPYVKKLALASLALCVVSTLWALAVIRADSEEFVVFAVAVWSPALFEVLAWWRGAPWTAVMVTVLVSVVALGLCILCTTEFTNPTGHRYRAFAGTVIETQVAPSPFAAQLSPGSQMIHPILAAEAAPEPPPGYAPFLYCFLFHGLGSLLQIHAWSRASMLLRRERHARMREPDEARG